MRVHPIVLMVSMGLCALGCSDDPATPASDAGTAADSGTTADTGAPADGGGGPWGCLGRVSPVVPGGSMVTIALHAVGFGASAPMVGVTVKACARTDTLCAMPHSMGVTDAMGNATLTGPVGPQGFDGYIELTGGTGPNEVVPTKMYPNPALTAGMRPVNARVIERETFMLLGAVLRAELNDTNGLITAAVSDCNRDPAAGATLSASPMPMGVRQFYTANNLPSLTATQTGPSGTGGFVGVPPGDYTLTATRVDGMARIGAASVNVRGGYITSINVGPSP